MSHLIPRSMLIGIEEITGQDIITNQQGQMSPAQRDYLHHLIDINRASQRRLVAGSWFALIAIGVFGGLLTLMGMRMDRMFVITYFILFGVMVVLSGVPVYFETRYAKPMFRDIRAGVVKEASGTARLRVKRGNLGTRYFILIGEDAFEIPQDTYERLEDGADYQVFYAPESGIFLAVSPDRQT
jgi:hypothetical protein